ncbi:hypothetical protein [Dyadobacter sp. 3J3]|uniref:hypothetical protein n=1 Tax=Dyadobacter sp. 3J3 TaxID=2606600 RepID=UPI0013575A9C|nr:hypothetical protein [Dyadobacter sp. 3J3]
MKIHFLLNAALLSLMSFTISAQVVSRDSIDILNHQKQAIEISKRLNDRKIELAKLENEMPVKTQDVSQTATNAQNAAVDNVTAADKLVKDAEDKKLARNAHHTAGEAQRDSRKARKAADKLENLTKDIQSLKDKISEDEQKLASIPGYPFLN